MATTHFSRSRSPVLSIRTQPEDEDNLRAAIEEANRTQHEILPRNPWQASCAKRDSKHTSRRIGRPLLARDLPPSQLARSFAVNNNDDDEGNDDYDDRPSPLPTTINTLLDTHGQRTSESRKPWRRFTKRHASSDVIRSFEREFMEGKDLPKQKSRNKSIKIFNRNDEVVTTTDREAREAQFAAWLAERLEEQNIVPDLTQSLPPKAKRAIRKSVYGSLSSTRSLFRSTPKSPYENLSLPTQKPAVPPHVWSFERKDELREYLNSTSMVSPVSPSVHVSKSMNVAKGIEPVELSAGPLPVELDGNSTNNLPDMEPEMSRTSTPSNGELPPYMENKKFHGDVAKDNTFGEPPGRSSEDMGDFTNAKYTCGSCKREIREYEVWDFCVICDVRDGVICNDCGKKGPGCQHEVEQLFRNFAIDERTTLSHHIQAQPQQIHETTPANSKARETEGTNFRNHAQHQPLGLQQDRQTLSTQNLTENVLDVRHQISTEIKNMRSDILKEVDHFRLREQELVYRERELSLRAREIEVRDQQTTLREREVAMQQRSEQLLRSYQTLASRQEHMREIHFKSPYTAADIDRSCDAQRIHDRNRVSGNETNGPNRHQLHEGPGAAIFKSEPEARIPACDIVSDDQHIRSHAGPKRKKDSSNASAGSTPNAASSPEQSRKALSRNNSDRGADRDDEDDEEGRRFPKKHKQDPSSPNNPQRLFACPFSKHDPLRFSSRNMEEKNYRGCTGHFLTDVSRLKQHLKRVHWQPESYCPRCYEEFEDSARLAEHARAQVACVARECPFPEKMDRTKQDKIHVKRPRVPPVNVWYDIYKVLFPGSPLPESPYVERDDPLVTPLSATPQHSVNNQAMQQLNESFLRKLNQHAELQNSHLQPIIRQALTDSFNELLGTFSLSPTASPGGAGPSIVVSPVSRSPSDIIQTMDSPSAVFARPANLERQRSVTNIVSGPQQVPLLQQPRPPKLQVKTELRVPPGRLGRSPSNQRRQDSPSSANPADVVFDVSIPSHVRDDEGYDDECHSFEQGDDLQAMAFVDAPDPPAHRNKSNKSVVSIDSGYGSSRSQQHPALESSKSSTVNDNRGSSSSDYEMMGETNAFKHQEQPFYATKATNGPSYPTSHQDEYNPNHFSYMDYLDMTSQEMLTGMNLAFMDQSSNPWNMQ